MASRHQTSYIDVRRASRVPIMVSLFATVEQCITSDLLHRAIGLRRHRGLPSCLMQTRKADTNLTHGYSLRS
eukprot:2325693-Prymnesium_polylepis.2